MSYQEDIYKASQVDLPWGLLSGCNILVTGATGLIGGCLVDVLMARKSKDYHVYASGRKDSILGERFSKYLGDIHFHFIKYDVINPLVSNIAFDYIIHAASNASPNSFGTLPVEVMKSNLYGVVNLMEYGIRHGLRRFLYISSGEVYGEGDGRIFTEDYSGYVDCLSPRSCYPSSKRAAETLCVSYGVEYGIDAVVARPCHTYGPYFTDSDNRVYAQFIRNVLRGEDIVMKSTGSQIRSWCYVVDCACALLYILLKGDKGQAYNIADSRISIKELAEIVAKIGGKKVIVDLAGKDDRQFQNPVTKSQLSINKLLSLGWEVKSDIESNLRSTINELKIK